MALGILNMPGTLCSYNIYVSFFKERTCIWQRKVVSEEINSDER